jgi:AcrR family transcriptional regulator
VSKPAQNPRARKIPKSDAITRFLDATISLVGTMPVAEISDQLIADTAGINRASIYRYFGTRLELFDAAVDVLVSKWEQAWEQQLRPVAQPRVLSRVLNEPTGTFVEYSLKVFDVGAYLSASSYESEQLRKNFNKLVEIWMREFETEGASPRMARALAHKMLALNLARPGATKVADLSAESVFDVFRLTLAEAKNFSVAEAELGWNTEAK